MRVIDVPKWILDVIDVVNCEPHVQRPQTNMGVLQLLLDVITELSSSHHRSEVDKEDGVGGGGFQSQHTAFRDYPIQEYEAAHWSCISHTTHMELHLVYHDGCADGS